MPKTVEFYYDYGSPTAYLAWTQLPALCSKYGATLNYRPILLGGVFKATGNSTPVNIKPKGKWLFDDISRYANRYNVPFMMNPYFIINSMAMMRGALWAKNTGVLEPYNKAMFEATWAKGLDTGDNSVLSGVLQGAGLDDQAMLESIKEDAIKKQLIDETEKAVGVGVFGAPTMIVDGEMHFGQDRLDWIEQRLSQ